MQIVTFGFKSGDLINPNDQNPMAKEIPID